MARTTIRSEDITAGQVKSADLASDAVDTTGIQDDIAILGFKVAANGSLSKYNLVDQTIDDFQDATGIDASASTNDGRNAANYYTGTSSDYPTGGTVTTSGSYRINTFTSNGTLVSGSSGDVEYLIVAGGGSGGYQHGGGGGAGGFRTNVSGATSGGGGSAEAAMSLSAASYSVVVGSGGNGAAGTGNNGGDSSFNSITSTGGGGGGRYDQIAGNTGGSGGGRGGAAYGGSAAGAAGTANQGYGGGAGGNYSTYGGGGGGGAGGAGNRSTSVGGTGGVGVQSSIDGTTYYYAGGGGGAKYNSASNGPSGSGGAGGGGGGGNGNASNRGSGGAGRNNGAAGPSYDGGAGGANTGGGGGGAASNSSTSGAGGSGIVIVRYLTTAFQSVGADMTLVSNATTAEAVPTKGDLVMTYTNGAGTATINTDIKGWVSRDNGTTYTQFTLADEGDTGGHTILTAHDLDISGQPSGTAMRYKITTHNQSASKETRIQAVSLGWS